MLCADIVVMVLIASVNDDCLVIVTLPRVIYHWFRRGQVWYHDGGGIVCSLLYVFECQVQLID